MNPLGNNEDVVSNKLILLYIISKLKLPVSNLQLTNMVLGSKLMNFFHLQQCLDELNRPGYLIITTSEGRSSYSITSSGTQVLELLGSKLMPGLKARLDSLVSSVYKKVKNEIMITADYTPKNENEFTVTCKVGEENFTLMKLEVMTGTGNDARSICSNWENFSQEIYAEIIESLTRKRK